MWIRGAQALALSLLLLLASTVGMVAHDHGAGAERAAVDCSVDHEAWHEAGHDAAREAGDGGDTPATTAATTTTHAGEPTLHAAGELHQHHCVGCRHSGQRGVLVLPPSLAEHGPDADATPAIPDSPVLSQPTSGPTPRGPPRA